MAMDDVRALVAFEHELQRCPAEKSKPLVIEGHYEAGDSTPGVLITSWFDAAFIQPNGSGSFGVTISPYLKPYLLQVKREFFKYNLGYVVRLKSSYSIRLYEWAKRWQFAGKRRIELDELRQVLGAVELNKMGGIKKYLLVPYKNLKARAIDPAVKELNANTEVSISYAEHKDGKRVVALTFLFRQNSKNAAKLDTMQIPPDAQMELEIELVQKPAQATAETDSDREAALLEAKVQPEFGLSARQLDMVREFNQQLGMTVVMVTHERTLAERYAQRLIFLADGTLISDEVNSAASPMNTDHAGTGGLS